MKLKKILAVVLCLCMVLGSMSFSVLAVGTTVTTEAELKDALAADGNVVLGNDIHVTAQINIPAGTEVSLDLAGYEITSGYQAGSSTKHVYPFSNNGIFTITDSSEGNTGSISGRGIYNQDGGILTLTGVKVINEDWNGGACVWAYGSTSETYLNNCTMIGSTGVVSSEGYLEINGGTYTCYSGIDDEGNQLTAPTYNIRAYNGLKITDGVFTSRHGVISLTGGEGVIEKGTFTIESIAKITSNVVYVYGKADLTIESGIFAFANDKADSGAAVLVSGEDPELEINGGTYVGLNGMVSVNDKTVINGGSYDTIWDYNHYGAIESAVSVGSTINVGEKKLTKTTTGLDEVPAFVGSGTETDPYIISNVDDLMLLRNNVNKGKNYEGENFELVADIDLTALGNWTPIGNGTRSSKKYSGNAFKGSFDGGNYSISGLTITSSTGADAAVGLFGVVDGGTVKNLNLADVNIDVKNSNLAGGAIGMMLNGAVADNITVSGSVTGHDGVGGIVGRMIISGTISNCTNNADVSSSYGGIGGIVGKAYYEDGANTDLFGKISNCVNNGVITAPMYVGGIVGLARCNVVECTNNGAVVGGTQTGGIIGQLIAAGEVSENENTAKISGKNHLGGIIGDYSQSSAYTYNSVSINKNINRGELAATEQCAAIMGCNNIDGFTGIKASGNVSYYFVEGLELFGNPEDMVIDDTNTLVDPYALASSGNKYYRNLQDAVNDAEEDAVITILLDGELTEGIKVAADKKITIDLNGNTVSMNVAATKTSALITNNGTLTIMDSGEDGKLTYASSKVSTGYSTTTIINNGTLTVKSGTVENTSSTGGAAYAIDNYNTLTVNGGKILATNTRAIRQAQFGNYDNTVTVTDGIISGKNGGMQVHVFSTSKKTTTNIENGTFEGSYAFFTSFYIKDSSSTDININGGTFDGYVYLYNGNNDSSQYALDVSITDGKFMDEVFVYSKDANGNIVPVKAISGGVYSSNVSAYMVDGVGLSKTANGYEVVDNSEFAGSVSVEYKDITDKETEGEKTYEIVLKAGDNGTIHELASVDLSFVYTRDPAAGGAIDFTVLPAKDFTMTRYGKTDRYMFNYNGVTAAEGSGSEITIGTITVSGYGKYTIATADATTNIVNTTTISDNLVTSYTVAGASDGDATTGALVINDDTVAADGMVGKVEGKDAEIAVPTRELTITIDFPNGINDNVAAYQDMKVEITGNIDGVNKTVTYDLGKGADAYAMNANGSYVIAEDRLVLDNAYTVAISGAGYRTVRYTVTMTEKKALRFWNNVADKAQVVEIGEDSSAVDVTFLAGDIVKDNKINIYDLSAVVSYFGRTNDTDAYTKYAKYDLDRNGVIDSKDVAYVLVSWDK